MYIIWLAFFLSGIAGISYELVWAKYLVHLFGASTPAVSGTISIFFGGLALGAALFGRIFDRVSSPIRAYGILEIAIGCSAALVPWMVHTSESLLISWGSTGEMWPVRLLLSAGVLLVPATLIGATFPAMAAAARSMRDPTRRTALFYGVNTLGAVSGCVLTGFWTIPALGLQSTTWSMTFLNLAVGAMMLAISRAPRGAGERRAEVSHDGAAPVPATAAVPLAAPAPAVRRLSWRLVAVLSVTSGLLAIGTEVLWVRSLVLSFQGTVYVFAVVLTSYLIGIGAGSLLLASLRRFVRNDVSLLRYLYLGIGLSCVLAMILFPNFGNWSQALRDAGVVKSWGTHIFTLSGLALLAMLPATLAMGASLPLLIGLADIPRREGRTAGTLYALNTFGGIAGSIGASFVLMPRLGLSGALMLHALGYLVLFAVIGIVRTQNTSKRIIAAAPALAAAVLFIVGIYPEVNGGRYIAGSRLLFYHDAPSGTVAIYEDRQRIRTLRVNNYYGLSDTSPITVRLQRRLGHIAMLLHPAPDRALLIGLATGTTLSAMGEYRLRALDCVELHPTVIDVASHFTSANRKIWQRADVHIQKGDGRHFLRREGETYDVIVGDLYLPINAGVGALYSREHFRAAKNRLAPNGVFVAWLPLYQIGPEQVASVARTFLEVFPDAEGWMGNWGKHQPVLGLVGWESSGAPYRDPADIEETLWNLSVEEPGLRTQTPVPSRQILTTELLERWAGDAPLNTLDHPVVEYGAPRALVPAWIQNTSLARRNNETIQRLLQPE